MDPRYQQLAARINLGHSERIAGLFALLADLEQAELLLALPAGVGELAAKLDQPSRRVEEMLKDLFRKGLVFSLSKADPPAWRMVKDMVQFHDATLVWPEATSEFIDLWRDFMEHEWPDLAKAISKKTAKPFTRVIPVGLAVPARAQILDFESLADIIAKAKKIAVTKCTCRLSMRLCERPLEVCLQVNRGAEYTITRGSGREVSKDEAMTILRQSEEAGLIHVTVNRQDVNNFICNCCPCCCQTMPVLLKYGTYVIDPSRYTAGIDAEACSGCGACHERCYFKAISWTEGEGSPSLVDPAKCMGCGLCLVTCPTQAISLEETRPAAFVPGAA